MNLTELERYLHETPEEFDQLVFEEYDKVDAMLATLRALKINHVSTEVAKTLKANIYVYDSDRCQHCGLIGGH